MVHKEFVAQGKTFWKIESVNKAFLFDIDNSLIFFFLGIKLNEKLKIIHNKYYTDSKTNTL